MPTLPTPGVGIVTEMIRPIYPEQGDPISDLVGSLLDDDRRPHEDGGARPWVLVNMVNSVDGATAVEGGATGLTDEDDQALFHAFRGVCDLILVGASTVRAEDYGPVRVNEDVAAARQRSGRSVTPRLAVISRSLDLDPEARLFSDPEQMPVLVTCASAPSEQVALLRSLTEVIVAGEDTVDLTVALPLLGERGHAVVLCEGGPTLNGHLVAGDLIDEINLSTSPKVVAGQSARIVRSPLPLENPFSFRLDRLLLGDRTLFARWLRHRA
jgi:riboflavin-specific deaminase-like protein